ncbi:MAG: M99 family metallo-carboxypeptidase C-terminal domain-containing protein [Candidatus Ratteibacteria bacterium]
MLKEIGIVILLISLVFLMFIVSWILIQIKRKKGLISLFLTLIFTIFALYYLYLVIYLKPISKKFDEYSSIEKVIITPKIEKQGAKINNIFLVLNLNGNIVKVSIGDEIEIKKDITFKITDVEGIEKENLKVNFIGFIGNPKFNDGQDIGYKISYKDIKKSKALDPKNQKYEIEIKKESKKIGSVYIKFID